MVYKPFFGTQINETKFGFKTLIKADSKTIDMEAIEKYDSGTENEITIGPIDAEYFHGTLKSIDISAIVPDDPKTFSAMVEYEGGTTESVHFKKIMIGKFSLTPVEDKKAAEKAKAEARAAAEKAKEEEMAAKAKAEADMEKDIKSVIKKGIDKSVKILINLSHNDAIDCVSITDKSEIEPSLKVMAPFIVEFANNSENIRNIFFVKSKTSKGDETETFDEEKMQDALDQLDSDMRNLDENTAKLFESALSGNAKRAVAGNSPKEVAMMNMLDRHNIIQKEFAWALQEMFEKVTVGPSDDDRTPFITLKDQLRSLFGSPNPRVQDVMTAKFGDMRADIEKQLAIPSNRGILPIGSQGSEEKNEQKLKEFVKDLEPIWIVAFGADFTFKNQWIINVNGKNQQVHGSKPKHTRFLKIKTETAVAMVVD